jgi:hypothetical protein
MKTDAIQSPNSWPVNKGYKMSEILMTRRLFTISFAFVTLLLSGCETLLDYGSIHEAYLGIYKINPQQQRAAQMQVRRYSGAVKRGKRAPAKSRYIAVQTLDPDPSQREHYAKQRESQRKIDEAQGRALAPEWVEPTKIHCLMVFDTQSKQFVGSGCYVVAALPAAEQLVKLETVTAEFVGGTGVL